MDDHVHRTTRLVVLGDARAMTNAPGGFGPPEPIMPYEYDA